MAVYTEIAPEEFKKLLSEYDIGVFKSASGITEGVENTNYLVITETGKYIFTIYEKRVKAADLPFFLGLMEHLSQNDIPCPVPIRDKSGKILKEIHEKPCSMASFLEGEEAKPINAENCIKVGEVMAKMHMASESFSMKRENSMHHGAWKEMFNETKSKANNIEAGLVEEIEKSIEDIDKNWPESLPSGVIHADLFPDNVFFKNKNISGVLDFYFACNDFFAYDLAITMNAWCFDGNDFNSSRAKAMLEGYNSIKPFTDNELEALPALAKGAALRFLLSRLYDWLNKQNGAKVNHKDPLEYLHKLRFHMNVKSHKEYGF